MAHATSLSVPIGALNEIRLILLGKSSLGNTILGNEIFVEKKNPKSVTNKCAINCRLFDEKQIFVVDTSGFFYTSATEAAMRSEVANSYQMTATPGPHAFLLVIEPNRSTEEQRESLKYLDKIFGSQAIHHTIIVFTHGDSFENTSIEEYLSELEQDDPLTTLLNQCQQRYITVNNKGTQVEKDETVRKLLEMINQLIINNKGELYRSAEFDAIAKEILDAKSKGIYQPFKPDGTFNILPQTQKIIIDDRLRRTFGRRPNES